MCVHARFCTRAGGIWNLTRQSGSREARDMAIEEAANSPSGHSSICTILMILLFFLRIIKKIQNPPGSTESQRAFAFWTSSHVGMARTIAENAKKGFAKDTEVKMVRTMPTRMRYTKSTLTS